MIVPAPAWPGRQPVVPARRAGVIPAAAENPQWRSPERACMAEYAAQANSTATRSCLRPVLHRYREAREPFA